MSTQTCRQCEIWEARFMGRVANHEMANDALAEMTAKAERLSEAVHHAIRAIARGTLLEKAIAEINDIASGRKAQCYQCEKLFAPDELLRCCGMHGRACPACRAQCEEAEEVTPA